MLRKPKEYTTLLSAFEKFRTQELNEFRDYLSHPGRIVWANFLAGTARGLGFLLGAAAVLTISGFVLKNYLANIPMVGDFFQALYQWIEQTLKPTH